MAPADTLPFVLFLLLGATEAAGQRPERSRLFEITDNSFLIEEAFNQEPRIFQNILLASRRDGVTEMKFTQEFPLGSQRHQLSYDLPFEGEDRVRLGDIVINYRYQALDETARQPAFAPRLSLVLPTGEENAGGAGRLGVETNLPFSKQLGDLYLHANAGARLRPREDLLTPFVGGSVILRVRSELNLMLESLAEWEESVSAARATSWTVSPGLRAGFDVGRDAQVVLGASVPIGLADASGVGMLVYLSYELPFR